MKNKQTAGQAARKTTLFQGEVMKCMKCGRLKKSDPGRSSQWTAIEIPDTGEVFYYCPQCFGNARLAGK